jgi:acyl-Coa thioesterase superfamily protein/acyl-CoA thioesterase superfamily protein
MTDHEFDRDTAVTPRGDGRYDAVLSPGWVVGGGVNGGYLLAVMTNALRAELPAKPDPIAVSAHYVSASTPGPATVQVDVRREGGSVATAAAELVQDGTTRISVLATLGDLARFAARAGGEVRSWEEPDLPPLEECVSKDAAPPEVRAFVPMLDRFDLRLDPAHAGWGGGEPGMTGSIAGWYRFADGREPDPVALLTICDVLPPVTFDLGMPGWAPTLELTVHVRARPAPGWLKVRHATRTMAGGMFEEDCEVWDSTGRLVAQSRQLALVPRPT